MRNVRIFYKKVGLMKFVSHLDINRYFSRLIRIAKLPVWYTEGFNVHPYVNFALPLSLGFEGNYEIVDIKIVDDNFSNKMIIDALKSKATPGFEIVDVSAPILKFFEISSAEYFLIFDNLDETKLSLLNNFLNNDSILTLKKTKKGNLKEVNIVEKIFSFEIIKTTFYFALKLKVSAGSDNLNPNLLISAFSEKTGITLPIKSIARTMLYDSCGNSFK